MDLIDWMLIIALNHVNVYSKHVDISDESIEKVLFYKDCRLGEKGTTTRPTTAAPKKLHMRRTVPPQNPCSTSCCAVCCPCNNQNGHPQRDLPYNAQPPLRMNPVMEAEVSDMAQSQFQPLNFRRSGVALKKDHIKKLISHDEDIKRILKDLVKVTMQKVNVLEILKATHKKNEMNSISNEDDDYSE